MSKFDQPGVGSDWKRIGRTPDSPRLKATPCAQPVISKEPDPPYAPNEVTLKFGIPTEIDQRFSDGRKFVRFVQLLPGVAAIIAFSLMVLFAKSDMPSLINLFVIQMVMLMHHSSGYLGSAKRKCYNLMKSKAEGDERESCALYYGRSEGIFYRGRSYWDVGLVDNQGGLSFEGTKHSFSLSADQITKAVSRPCNALGGEVLEIEWRTTSGNLSYVFLVDVGVNPNPADAKTWLAQTQVGSREPGPLPLDCSQFPTLSKKVYNPLLVILWAVGFGVPFYYLYRAVRPDLPPEMMLIFAVLIAVSGAYIYAQLAQFWLVAKGNKVADGQFASQ